MPDDKTPSSCIKSTIPLNDVETSQNLDIEDNNGNSKTVVTNDFPPLKGDGDIETGQSTGLSASEEISQMLGASDTHSQVDKNEDYMVGETLT